MQGQIFSANIYNNGTFGCSRHICFIDEQIDIASQAARVRNCVQSAFNGRRLMVFSGGAKKGENSVYDDARAIRDGGGNGSIIGRNTFQRPREEALAMLNKIIDIYKGKE